MTRLPIGAVSALALGATLGLAFGLSPSKPAHALQMWLPQVDNPYCNVPTYEVPALSEQAVSFIDSDGKPAIVIGQDLLQDNPDYAHFLMAHECCHHTLGHVREFHQEWGHIGPQPFYYMRPALRKMELTADCCAVKALLSRGEVKIAQAGEKAMAAFGNQQTGAYYPTGQERAANIEACAKGTLVPDEGAPAESPKIPASAPASPPTPSTAVPASPQNGSLP